MTPVQDRDGSLGTGYPTRMLVVCSLGWATIQCGRFVLPPLVPAIRSALGLSDAAIGLTFTAFGLVYAVTQYPSGTYSDTLSRATLILPGFLAITGSFVLLGLSTTVWLFVLAMLAFGVGKGLYTPPTRALLGDLFTARRGRALGIYSAGTDLGGVVAAFGLAVVVLETTVWQAAFVPLAVLLGFVTVLFLLWTRESMDLHRVDMAPRATARRIVATPAQRILLGSYAIFFFVVGGLTNFLPALLVEGGLSEPAASASFGLLFAVGLLIKPAAGELSDRFPRLGVSIAMLLVSAFGVALLLLVDSVLAVAAGTILAAAGYKTQFPITDAVVMEAAPADRMGGDLGAARAVFLTASSLGPGFVGIVADLASYATAFWVLAGLLVVSAGILGIQFRRG